MGNERPWLGVHPGIARELAELWLSKRNPAILIDILTTEEGEVDITKTVAWLLTKGEPEAAYAIAKMHSYGSTMREDNIALMATVKKARKLLKKKVLD